MFFVSIAIIALVVAVVLFWLWRRSGRIIVLVAAILWLAYALWEFAVQVFTPESNIRADLVIFYPILFLAGVIGLLFGLSPRKPEAKSGR